MPPRRNVLLFCCKGFSFIILGERYNTVCILGKLEIGNSLVAKEIRNLWSCHTQLNILVGSLMKSKVTVLKYRIALNFLPPGREWS